MFFTLLFNLRNKSIEDNGIIIQTLKRTTTQKKCMEACNFRTVGEVRIVSCKKRTVPHKKRIVTSKKRIVLM